MASFLWVPTLLTRFSIRILGEEMKQRGPVLWAEYNVSLLNDVKCITGKLEIKAYSMLKYLRAQHKVVGIYAAVLLKKKVT